MKIFNLICQGQFVMGILKFQVIFERRILLGCTVLVGLSVCIWSVAIGTDHWFTIEAPDKNGLPIGDPAKGRRLIYKNMGLWRGCVQGIAPESENSTKLIPFGKSSLTKRFSHFLPSTYFLSPSRKIFKSPK